MLTATHALELKKKVVILQDDSMATEILLYLIKKSERYDVVGVFNDYASSLKLIRRTKPHVIIADLVASGQDIRSFIEQFRRSSAETKIVILSDVDTEHMILEMFKCGVESYLFRAEGLHSIIANLDKTIQGENVLSPRVLARIISALKVNRNSPLSERESQVMKLLAQGMNSSTIAHRLNISNHTSRTHIKNIYKKLSVRTRSEAVRTALTERLV
jgi:DNA-binding NarL/FixJ family response regulator